MITGSDMEDNKVNFTVTVYLNVSDTVNFRMMPLLRGNSLRLIAVLGIALLGIFLVRSVHWSRSTSHTTEVNTVASANQGFQLLHTHDLNQVRHHTSSCVTIRHRASPYVIVRRHTCVTIRHRASRSVNIRQRTLVESLAYSMLLHLVQADSIPLYM